MTIFVISLCRMGRNQQEKIRGKRGGEGDRRRCKICSREGCSSLASQDCLFAMVAFVVRNQLLPQPEGGSPVVVDDKIPDQGGLSAQVPLAPTTRFHSVISLGLKVPSQPTPVCSRSTSPITLCLIKAWSSTKGDNHIKEGGQPRVMLRQKGFLRSSPLELFLSMQDCPLENTKH